MAKIGDVDSFTHAYLECAEWCGVDEEEREAFELSVSPKWSNEAIRKAIQDCDDFRSVVGSLLDGIDDEQAGHDFWLTRNGHGAGFWDRGLGKIGDQLTKEAQVYGEVHVWFDAESEELHFYG
jgi:hypothetical protein